MELLFCCTEYFFMIKFLCRTPRRLSGSLDSNAYARCRACCEGYSRFAYACRIVDSLKYDGARYRTVSGWKHSSTKVTLAGVVDLRSRFCKQNQFWYISIDSGTVFILFKKFLILIFICKPIVNKAVKSLLITLCS